MLTSRGPKEETHKNQLGEQLPLHNIGEAISSSEPHDSYLWWVIARRIFHNNYP